MIFLNLPKKLSCTKIAKRLSPFTKNERQTKRITSSPKHTIVQKQNKEPVDISELFQSNEIDYCGELYGIYIPYKELLQKTKYQWFLNLNVNQVLQSNTIIAKYMLVYF